MSLKDQLLQIKSDHDRVVLQQKKREAQERSDKRYQALEAVNALYNKLLVEVKHTAKYHTSHKFTFKDDSQEYLVAEELECKFNDAGIRAKCEVAIIQPKMNDHSFDIFTKVLYLDWQ